MTPCLGTSGRADADLRRASQLAEPVLRLFEGLGQWLPIDESIRSRGQSAGVSERDVRGAGILKISIAFHPLREVAVEDDRLVSKEGSHADKNAVEVIWNVYT